MMMWNLRCCAAPLTVVAVVLSYAGCLFAAQPSAQEQSQQLIDRGLNFLKAQQKEDGGWQPPNEPPGITAIVLRAFVGDEKYDAKRDFVSKGYEKLLSYQKPNGGIYQDMLANYNTSIALSALAAANAEVDDPAMKQRIDRATEFLKRLQYNDKPEDAPERDVVAQNDARYGGFGYGRYQRPDLSNTQFALEALHNAGVDCKDPAFQAALTFLTRTQNHSETNDQPWAGEDGGFAYTAANNGESMAGEYVAPDGRRMLRSYGSMTYAGLKSMIYAGLTKDDPRVKAALDWITKNWTLDENPGMRAMSADVARQGLYYYYYVFAHALDAYDQPVITDSAGQKHDWRAELIAKLGSLQRADGSWIGEKRWMEDNPVLTTAYVVLALEAAQKDLSEHLIVE